MRYILLLISIGIIGYSCSVINRDDQNELLLLKSNPINLSCKFTLYQNDSNHDFASKSESCKLVTYFDSSSCNGCAISNLDKWRNIINYAEKSNGRINIFFIFSSSFNNEIKMYLDYLKFDYPVLLDSLGEFERLNPHLPKNKAMHTFLLDEDNNVILVGNPLQNKEIEKMFYEEVEKRLR